MANFLDLNGLTYLKSKLDSNYATSTQLNSKQDKSTLEEDVSSKGFTKNTGTVTSVAVSMNGSTKGTITTSGTINLGTVLTEHQSLTNYYTKSQTDSAIATAIGNAISGGY